MTFVSYVCDEIKEWVSFKEKTPYKMTSNTMEKSSPTLLEKFSLFLLVAVIVSSMTSIFAYHLWS